MAKVKVDDITSGMVLREDIKGAQGNLLLKAGTALEQKHIKIFKTWGVTSVPIKSDAADETKEIVVLNESITKAAELLEPHFLLCNKKHPLISMLYKINLHHLAAKIQSEK